MLQALRGYLERPGLGPRLIKTSLRSAGLRLAGMFFSFLVGVQLARGLGVEGYGVYGMAMSIIALLSVVTEFGLAQLLIREIAAAQVNHDWGKVRGVLKWSSRTVLIFSILICTACVGWLLLTERRFSDPLSLTLLAGLLLVPLVAQGNLRSAALRGLQHIVIGQIPETLIRPAAFSLLLLLAVLSMPLYPALAMALGVVSAGASLLCSIALLRKKLPPEVLKAEPQSDSSAWRASALPMAFSDGMRVLQAHLVVLILGYLSTFEMVGLFRVASSMALLIAFPISLFTVMGAPVIARLYAQNDYERLQQLLSWLSLGMTGATIALSLPFLIAGEPLLGLIFGRDLEAANPVLLVLNFSNLVSAFLGANAIVLNMTGNQVRVTRASWISLSFLGLTCPPFIMALGAIGAALAFSLASFIWNILMWRDTMKILSLNASFVPLLRRTPARSKMDPWV